MDISTLKNPDRSADYVDRSMTNALIVGTFGLGYLVYMAYVERSNKRWEDIPKENQPFASNATVAACLAAIILFLIYSIRGFGRFAYRRDLANIEAGTSPTKMLLISLVFVCFMFLIWLLNWNQILFNLGLFPPQEYGGSTMVVLIQYCCLLLITFGWFYFMGFYFRVEYGMPRYVLVYLWLVLFIGTPFVALDLILKFDDANASSGGGGIDTNEDKAEWDEQAKNAPPACINATIKVLLDDPDFLLYKKQKADGDSKAKKKFRSLSMKYHPDRCSETCKEICTETFAYLVKKK
jgi:hypothetical protein